MSLFISLAEQISMKVQKQWQELCLKSDSNQRYLRGEAHHGDEATNEAEVREMVRVDGGGRVYLETVVVLSGVFKQAVHGVQDFMGQQEEPLPAEPEDKGHQ